MKTTCDNNQIISSETEAIRSRIYLIRAQQVMLDKDIAALYEVKPIRLREQVHRNIERFTDGFMFQLTDAAKTLGWQPCLCVYRRGCKPALFSKFEPGTIVKCSVGW